MRVNRLPRESLLCLTTAVLAGVCLHFLYMLLPCALTAAVSPVRESLWEHVKILYWPGLAAGLFLNRREPELAGARGFSLLLAAGVMLAAGWVYHVGLEGDAFLFDIVLYVAVMALCVALPGWLRHPFWRRTGRLWWVLTAVLGGATVLFTWLPPGGALFADLSLAAFAPIPW